MRGSTATIHPICDAEHIAFAAVTYAHLHPPEEGEDEAHSAWAAIRRRPSCSRSAVKTGAGARRACRDFSDHRTVFPLAGGGIVASRRPVTIIDTQLEKANRT